MPELIPHVTFLREVFSKDSVTIRLQLARALCIIEVIETSCQVQANQSHVQSALSVPNFSRHRCDICVHVGSSSTLGCRKLRPRKDQTGEPMPFTRQGTSVAAMEQEGDVFSSCFRSNCDINVDACNPFRSQGTSADLVKQRSS